MQWLLNSKIYNQTIGQIYGSKKIRFKRIFYKFDSLINRLLIIGQLNNFQRFTLSNNVPVYTQTNT